MKSLKPYLSRKFLLALVGAIVVFLNGAYDLGLNTEEVLTMAGLLISFIAVEGAADIKER